jgi:hypothetical protein
MYIEWSTMADPHGRETRAVNPSPGWLSMAEQAVDEAVFVLFESRRIPYRRYDELVKSGASRRLAFVDGAKHRLADPPKYGDEGGRQGGGGGGAATSGSGGGGGGGAPKPRPKASS